MVKAKTANTTEEPGNQPLSSLSSSLLSSLSLSSYKHYS